jgi:hypothetical protein
VMFEIKPLDPATYRQQTRRSTLCIALLFTLLAMTLSAVTVSLWGQPGGDNFRCNLAGVLTALLLTAALVRYRLCAQPWMAAAVYGWQLKRSLMRITNIMHHVTAGVMAGDLTAIKVLRFYHLGLTQMHELDGNSSAIKQVAEESAKHCQTMQKLGLDTGQARLNSDWLTTVKELGSSQ